MRLSIRAKLFLATASVSILFVLAVVTPINRYVNGIVRNEVQASLRAGVQALDRFLRLKQDFMLERIASIANTPYLKATIGIPDVTTDTVTYALEQLGDVDGDESLLVLETDGRVLARRGPDFEGVDALTDHPGFAAALRGQSLAGVWHLGGRHLHTAIAPVTAGEQIVGVLAIASPLDATFARDAREFSGSSVVVFHDASVIAASTSESSFQGLSEEELLVAADWTDPGLIHELRVGGHPSLGMRVPILDSGCHALLFRRTDDVDAGLRRVRNTIIATGLGTLLLAVFASYWVASRVSGSVRLLSDTVRQFGPDNLELRSDIRSRDELGELATSFNRMADRLAANTERIRYLAYYDALTGLPNGEAFKERLADAVARARVGESMAVVFLDLDRFKRVNDTLGHDSGDQLLREVGRRLVESTRRDDEVAYDASSAVVSRMGSDHFMVLLRNIAGPEDAAHFATRLDRHFSEPVKLGPHDVYVRASIGISVFPQDGRDAPTLLKNADVARHHAKDVGGSPFEFFSHALAANSTQHMTLESDLRKALERDQLLLHYQPQICLKTDRVVGAEALLRWQHPDRGLIPPAEFIPLAEVTGLIVDIGDWILHTAATEAKRWSETFDHPIRVGVNISGVQFRPDLVSTIQRVVSDVRIDPRLLDLEITESVVMQSAESTIRTLEELKRMGATLSIDDFGTGYSSLSYLRRFPIDTLKIDRCFITDLVRQPEDAAIVQAIIAMARSLQYRVIAEGVEDEQQVAFLREAGCDEVQGFVFAKPMPAEAFLRYVAERPVDTYRRAA